MMIQWTQERRKMKKELEKLYEDQNIPPRGQESVSSANSIEEEREIALVSTENGKVHKMNKKTWLADSGASSHMTNNNEGIFGIELVNSIITIGDGKVIKSTMAGSIEF